MLGRMDGEFEGAGADAVIMGFPDSRKLLNRLSALFLSTPTSFSLPLRPLLSFL